MDGVSWVSGQVCVCAHVCAGDEHSLLFKRYVLKRFTLLIDLRGVILRDETTIKRWTWCVLLLHVLGPMWVPQGLDCTRSVVSLESSNFILFQGCFRYSRPFAASTRRISWEWKCLLQPNAEKSPHRMTALAAQGPRASGCSFLLPAVCHAGQQRGRTSLTKVNPK